MKKLIALSIGGCMAAVASAQLQVNPQIGTTFTNLTNAEPGVEYKAAVGFGLGVDFRIGDRFYFQPGAFFTRNATTVKYAFSDTAVIEDNLIRTNLKLKALVGYNLVNGDAFKLRINAGPTYDVLLSVDSKDSDIKFNKDDYNAGSFNMDAGLGVDITIISLETGISYGLSNAYKEVGALQSDAKYFTFYLTAGVVLGKGGGD